MLSYSVFNTSPVVLVYTSALSDIKNIRKVKSGSQNKLRGLEKCVKMNTFICQLRINVAFSFYIFFSFLSGSS